MCEHLANFVPVYNFTKGLKIRTPYDCIWKR